MKKCPNCNQEVVKPANKYCDGTCQIAYQEKQKVSRWLNGWNPTNYELPRAIRNFLLEEAGYKCTSPDCAVPGGWSGINPRSGKTTLTVDHIDGNASHNLRRNLRVLCPNCHSLTPTFGGLNKGNGRSNRRR